MSTIFSQMCVCGHVFSDIGAFTRHEKTCKRGKKCLLGTLEKAKEIYQSKKSRLSVHSDGAGGSPWEEHTPVTIQDNNLVCAHTYVWLHKVHCCRPKCHLAHELEQEDDTLSLAQHRPHWHNCQLPLQFRDCLPEAPMPLPPPVVPQADPTSGSWPVSLARACFQKFKSQMNKFGLYQLYCMVLLPSHDPDDPHSISQPHPDPIVSCNSGSPQNPYHPDPNQNSFHLGEWYWNQGVQKSWKSFK